MAPTRGAGSNAGAAGDNLTSMKLGIPNLNLLESVAAQEKLQVLDLKDNMLAAVPAEVFKAYVHVKVLDLRKNTLEEILPDISAMVSLEDLLLDQNRLKEIPPEVCQLPRIRNLSLSQNVLTGLPKAISDMTKLRSLTLGDNHITEIPEEIGRCNELQTLYLHHNRFTRLPTTVHGLVNLNEFSLEWFRYTTPPLPRVLKGSEWQRVLHKLMSISRERFMQGSQHLTCIEILSMFSQKPFDPNAIDSKRRTRLHVACLEGHVGVAMALAESGSRPPPQGKIAVSPVMGYQPDVNSAVALMESQMGSRCDSLDCEGYSPLLVAVREEHQEIATALVRVGVDVNCGGGLFGSPLHVATVNFDPRMVLLLLCAKADVNQTDADGNTPLHVLMSVFDKGGKRASAIGQILLRHSADCNMMNTDKWAPIHLGARRGQLRGICFVLSHIDNVDPRCLRGACSHQPTHKKTRSARVRTCMKAFDLNLRGGSHLWTPLHLAGHACHVSVVQVLVEAGADVFLRNVDGRTARHVSRGNLAITKLLRKAEDEWLWHRIHQESRPRGSKVPNGDYHQSNQLQAFNMNPANLSEGAVDSFLESLKADGEEDAIEELARSIEGTMNGEDCDSGTGPQDHGGNTASDNSIHSLPSGPNPGAPQRRRSFSRQQERIVEKCCDMHFSKADLGQMQSANYVNPPATTEEFANLLVELSNSPMRSRLPFALSKRWVKGFLLRLFEDPNHNHVLLDPLLATNEDFLRLLISHIPKEKLSLFGEVRSKDKDTILHVLCKGNDVRAFPSTASRADILLLLLTVCAQGTFDMEARDLRGQAPLHLAAQSGDMGLVQVLLEYGADSNTQEETTGWTPLHFAVSKNHYALILQFLHHDSTNVNQVDKFDWPPLLEACSRLDPRSTALLVNGRANIGFRNQHHFDVLKAVDTSKKDLAAKRWMSCLVVSNGFRFEESTVQLNNEDRATLVREQQLYDSRQTPEGNPPFYVPDHLAPRCRSCKVTFSMQQRRCHCRSCGLVLCDKCLKPKFTHIVALDERVRCRQKVAQALAVVDDDDNIGHQKSSASFFAPPILTPSASSKQGARASATFSTKKKPTPAIMPGTPRSDDSGYEDPPPAEELPPLGPPTSVVCPGAMPLDVGPPNKPRGMASKRDVRSLIGGLSRDWNSSASSARPIKVRLCTACAIFFEVGVGETYAMLHRKEGQTQAVTC